jgi:actin-like ATPase involved in cell morphogenesis
MWIGIDFGTSNSCAAIVTNDTVRLVADPGSGNYTFPSSVFVEKDGHVLVGQFAENKQAYDALCYHNHIKLDLGRKEAFTLGNYKKYPADLVSEVLKKLKSEAERQITHHPLTSAVVTVPASYEKPLRNLMQYAAQQAGFTRIELLEEPVAAAVYYASQAGNAVKDGETFLVYDLGGGTFDATLIRRRGLRYELLGAPDGRSVGGVDFDNSIYADMLAKSPAILRENLAKKQYKFDRLRVRAICREVKHTLSTVREVRKNVSAFGQAMSYRLSYQEFISMIGNWVDETITCCEGLLKRANIPSKDVRCVLLVGGSCRIPYIRVRLKQRLGIDVFPVDEPELAVSMGAALYGDALDRAENFVREVDALCSSQRFYAVLHSHLPELFQNLAQSLARLTAQEAVKPALQAWKNNQLDNLNSLQPFIERFIVSHIESTKCKEEIARLCIEWVQRRIPELAQLSDPICDSYRVSRNILRLPGRLPQLEARSIAAAAMQSEMNLTAFIFSFGAGKIQAWLRQADIAGHIRKMMLADTHMAAPLQKAQAKLAASLAAGAGKTQVWVKQVEWPAWLRKKLFSDAKIEAQVQQMQETLASSMVSEMEKNKSTFERFLHEVQRILQATIHEQATREARFIWLHSNEE